MKIAVTGKGGSGKTTVSGTLARVFAANGYDVVAIDEDDDPNLAVSLGVSREADVPALPDGLVSRVETPEDEASYELTRPPREIIDEYGFEGPDGVTLLRGCEVVAGGAMIGHIAVSLALSNYEEDPGEVVVVDMAPHVDYLGVADNVDVLLLVGEPTYSSLETVRKMYVVGRGIGFPDSKIRILANDIRTDRDRAVFDDYCADRGLEVADVIPHDDAVRRAERDRLAPVDYDADSPAVRTLRELAEDLATHVRQQPGQDSALDAD